MVARRSPHTPHGIQYQLRLFERNRVTAVVGDQQFAVGGQGSQRLLALQMVVLQHGERAGKWLAMTEYAHWQVSQRSHDAKSLHDVLDAQH